MKGKECYYEQLQATLNTVPKKDLENIMGDMNAKVEIDNETDYGQARHWSYKDVIIGGTIFPTKRQN